MDENCINDLKNYETNKIINEIIQAVKKKGRLLITDCFGVNIIGFDDEIDLSKLPKHIKVLGYKKGITTESYSNKWYLIFSME
ncbi:MAG: hypothetical protein ACTSQE_08455 [Candidatus Heimdallarchaeaceae archaeon]